MPSKNNDFSKKLLDSYIPLYKSNIEELGFTSYVNDSIVTLLL